MLLYSDKQAEYYRHVRLDILRALPHSVQYAKVIELGAGGCDTLVFMKEKKIAVEVTGVELFDLPGSNQHNVLVDNLIIGDVAMLDTFNLKKKSYNLVICGDVLEHTYDPWHILKVAKELLTDDGMLICSIPNFRFIRNMVSIFFRGDFKYTKEGSLDKTHIRFFCKKNLIDLFRNTGYIVKKIEPNFIHSDSKADIKKRRINNLSFGLLEEFLAFQYIVQVEKIRI